MNKREVEKKRIRMVSAKKWAQQHDSGSRNTLKIPDGVEFFKVDKAGPRKIDIVPYYAGKGNPRADEGSPHWERTFWVHRFGPNAEMRVCAQKTFNKPCPICEYRAEQIRNGENDDIVKALAPKERQLFNVIDNDDRDKGVQIWDYSYHLFGKHLKKKIDNADEDDGYEFFADPDKGFRVKIGFSKETMGSNPFYTGSDIEFKTRDPLTDEELNSAVCLDELLVCPDYKELKRVFLQEGDDPDDDAEDNSPKKTSPKAKDEEEEELDETEQDEEESLAAKAGINNGDKVMFKGEVHEVVKIGKNGDVLFLEDEEGDALKAPVPVDKVKKVKKKQEEPEEDEDMDEKPKPKKKVVEPDEDEEPSPRARKKPDPDEDEDDLEEDLEDDEIPDDEPEDDE